MNMDARQRRNPPRSTIPRTRQSPTRPKKEPKTWKTKLLQLVLTLGVSIILLVLYGIFISPSPLKHYPASISLPSPPDLDGSLKPNKALTRANKLFKGKIKGPESLVVDGDVIYTGTADGKVVVIERGEIRTLTQFGKPPCEGAFTEPTCGRPLGMRMQKDGYLAVIDTYYGLYRVNVATGDHFQLFPTSMEIEGRAPRFLNDLDITKEGIMYITDSCQHYQRRDYMYSLLDGQATGRLIRYNPETNSSEVIMSGLLFANGVQLSRKEDYLLVAETGMARIWKYHLKGSQAGEAEIFAVNLPGLPDNIRRCSKGGYWVGMATCRNSQKFSLADFVSSRPWIRKLVSTVLSPPVIAAVADQNPCGLLVQLSTDGTVVRTLQDPAGAVIGAVSEVEDRDGVLYLGSFKAPFIGKLYDHGVENR